MKTNFFSPLLRAVIFSVFPATKPISLQCLPFLLLYQFRIKSDLQCIQPRFIKLQSHRMTPLFSMELAYDENADQRSHRNSFRAFRCCFTGLGIEISRCKPRKAFVPAPKIPFTPSIPHSDVEPVVLSQDPSYLSMPMIIGPIMFSRSYFSHLKAEKEKGKKRRHCNTSQ